MAKTYTVYHNDSWIPATFVKPSEELNRIWVEYDHVEGDGEGNIKEPFKRTIHIGLNDPSLRVEGTDDETE